MLIDTLPRFAGCREEGRGGKKSRLLEGECGEGRYIVLVFSFGVKCWEGGGWCGHGVQGTGDGDMYAGRGVSFLNANIGGERVWTTVLLLSHV